MIQHASLFEDPFDRQGLADKVRALSRQNILIGTSSWRYEGWLGKSSALKRKDVSSSNPTNLKQLRPQQLSSVSSDRRISPWVDRKNLESLLGIGRGAPN